MLGRVVASWGVRGWIKVAPFDDEPDALVGRKQWWLRERRGEWRIAQVSEARTHGKAVIAALAGVATREQAEALRGAEVGLPREALPAIEDNEVYWTDLVGLAVVNGSGAMLGRVREVRDYGAHPVLHVDPDDGAEMLIPFVDAHVKLVDLQAGRIEVDWEEAGA